MQESCRLSVRELQPNWSRRLDSRSRFRRQACDPDHAAHRVDLPRGDRPRRAGAPCGRASQRAQTSRPPVLMATSDLRDWIALLEREGELVRVGAEVDPHLEVTEIVTPPLRSDGPARLL